MVGTPHTGGRPLAYEVRYRDPDLTVQDPSEDTVYHICATCAGATDDSGSGRVRVRRGEFRGKWGEPVFAKDVDMDEFANEVCESCGKPLVDPEDRMLVPLTQHLD